MNWIKVSDRLPEQNKQVLVVTVEEYRGVPSSYITKGYQHGHQPAWFDWETDERITVTHWAPRLELPE